jgi:hypothetical protein
MAERDALHLAREAAKRYVERLGPRESIVVFSLTDGADTMRRLSPDRVLRTAMSTPRQDVTAYAVGIGFQQYSGVFVRQLAELTGGRYFDIGAPDQIGDTFEAVRERYLRYRFPDRDEDTVRQLLLARLTQPSTREIGLHLAAWLGDVSARELALRLEQKAIDMLLDATVIDPEDARRSAELIDIGPARADRTAPDSGPLVERECSGDLEVRGLEGDRRSRTNRDDRRCRVDRADLRAKERRGSAEREVDRQARPGKRRRSAVAVRRAADTRPGDRPRRGRVGVAPLRSSERVGVGCSLEDHQLEVAFE